MENEADNAKIKALWEEDVSGLQQKIALGEREKRDAEREVDAVRAEVASAKAELGETRGELEVLRREFAAERERQAREAEALAEREAGKRFSLSLSLSLSLSPSSRGKSSSALRLGSNQAPDAVVLRPSLRDCLWCQSARWRRRGARGCRMWRWRSTF